MNNLNTEIHYEKENTTTENIKNSKRGNFILNVFFLEKITKYNIDSIKEIQNIAKCSYIQVSSALSNNPEVFKQYSKDDTNNLNRPHYKN